jgi:hypothetical protein
VAFPPVRPIPDAAKSGVTTPAKAWPIATLVLGVATLVLVLAFGQLPEVRAAYPGGDFSQNLSAFQRAESMSDLNALFGAPPDDGKLAAMSAGNTLDLYGFVPAYALFLIAGALMLGQGSVRPLAPLAIVFALIGAGADALETRTQLAMTADWTRAEAMLPLVAPSAWIKYFGLSFHALACSAMCLAGERKRWILGGLGFVPVTATFADWTGAIQVSSLMSAAFGAFWIALLVIAAQETFARRA